jgi:hypothetical protein
LPNMLQRYLHSDRRNGCDRIEELSPGFFVIASDQRERGNLIMEVGIASLRSQ